MFNTLRKGKIIINKRDHTFQVIDAQSKITNGSHGLGSNLAAITTFGMSRIAEKSFSHAGRGLRNLLRDEYDFSDLLSFELIEDDSTISSGGVGRSLVFGAVAGAPGAIVGAITGKKKTRGIVEIMYVAITVNDMDNPTLYVPFITHKTKKGSAQYMEALNSAKSTMSALNLIANNAE